MPHKGGRHPVLLHLKHEDVIVLVGAKSECKVSQEPAAAIHPANAAEEPSAASQRTSLQDCGFDAGAL